MNFQILAITVQEGGKLVTELIKTRPRRRAVAVDMPSLETSPEAQLESVEESKASSIEAGCVPCSVNHFSTCSGLMAEALRFGRKEGINSDEVISRVNLCLDELNSLERVDLRPELIVNLPKWEKELANKALSESRNARHNLEGISTTEDLEKVTANIQSTRQSIGREWFKQRLARMSPEEKQEVASKVIEKLETETDSRTKKELEDFRAMKEASRIKG